MGSDLQLLQSIRGSNQRPKSTNYYGDVWDYLYKGLPAGTVLFNQNILSIGDVNSPEITTQHGTKKFDMVILADGGWSTLRKHVVEGEPEYAGYTLWRGLLDNKHMPEFRSSMSQLGSNYQYVGLGGFTCSRPGLINFGIYVPMPPEEVPKPVKGENR